MNFSRSFKKSYLDFKIPAIMGILNITPDSFSDGGKYFSKPSIAIQNAIKMQKMGADIIDIGAESTRPGALPIKPEVEIKRLKPIILGLKKKNNLVRLSGELKEDDIKSAGCRLTSRCPFYESKCNMHQDIIELRPGQWVRCWKALEVENLNSNQIKE